MIDVGPLIPHRFVIVWAVLNLVGPIIASDNLSVFVLLKDLITSVD
jgi:hypothetical protein